MVTTSTNSIPYSSAAQWSVKFPRFIGFDSLLDEIAENFGNAASNSSYPPYNIYKEGKDYVVEFAVAGFRKKDLNVEYSLKDQQLTVIGQSNDKRKDKEFIHRRISAKDFKHTFRLGEHVKVDEAKYDDGLLTIRLIKDIPEEEKPVEVKIK